MTLLPTWRISGEYFECVFMDLDIEWRWMANDGLVYKTGLAGLSERERS